MFIDKIKTWSRLQINLSLASLIALSTILKYYIDAKTLYVSYPNMTQLYALFFFFLYGIVIFLAIRYVQLQSKQSTFQYADLWFAGFKFLVLNCLIQVVVSLIMEGVFPNIRISFIQEQRHLLEQQIFNKALLTQNMIAIQKYYYILKISYFMFGILVLGTILNTTICIAIYFYYKKMIKR